MERSKLYSIFKYKCPHCHEGEFFVDRNPYHLSTAGAMLDRCPVCQRKYQPEPGFYYGGMYVTYAITVALFVTTYVAMLVLVPNAPLWLYAVVVIAGIVLLAPWIYALSKTIWANLFFSYKGIEPTATERAHAAERSATTDR